VRYLGTDGFIVGKYPTVLTGHIGRTLKVRLRLGTLTGPVCALRVPEVARWDVILGMPLLLMVVMVILVFCVVHRL